MREILWCHSLFEWSISRYLSRKIATSQANIRGGRPEAVKRIGVANCWLERRFSGVILSSACTGRSTNTSAMTSVSGSWLLASTFDLACSKVRYKRSSSGKLQANRGVQYCKAKIQPRSHRDRLRRSRVRMFLKYASSAGDGTLRGSTLYRGMGSSGAFRW